MKHKDKIFIFAYAAHGKGLSGGDRIFIEFARRWSKIYPINIYLWTEGFEMCQRQNLKGKNLNFKVSEMIPWKNFGFVVNYFARIFEGVRLGLTIKLTDSKRTVLYSASDFWMDSLPAFILKLRYPKIKWVASWYQTAPNPLKGYAEGAREEKYNFKALLYWLSQLPIKPLISGRADYVLVNNEEEKKQFPDLNRKGKTIVVIGAVDLEKIGKWKAENGNFRKVYDAVFQGRFHPQKGVVELVEIWRKVVDKVPSAKLAMIGDGPLRKNVELRIKDYGLEKNIKLFGYLFDGNEKYKIFSQSKIAVHPAFYDSGGMASAEAMAFGLPVVGFNLKAYKSYYPEGMAKVKIGDKKAFALKILELLNYSDKRKKLTKKAVSMLEKNWTWDERADEVLRFIKHD